MPTADVDGLKIHYRTAGDGPAILLLHGYAETSLMWRPLIPRLEGQFTVIAPDLPGIGESDVPAAGLDLTSAARRIHSLMAGLDIRTSIVVGHDIGLMVAYAYAALFPAETQKLVLMDAFIPGVDGWEAIHNQPGLWHFDFTVRRRRRSSAGASAPTSTTTGTNLRPIARDRFPGPIARPTPPRTLARVACARRGPISSRFRARRSSSRNSPAPGWPCRCSRSVATGPMAVPSASRESWWQ